MSKRRNEDLRLWDDMYKPVWDFLGSLVVGCSLKKVQAFLNGVAMVFFQEAIWFWLIDTKQSLWICFSIPYLCKWMYSLGLLYNIYYIGEHKKITNTNTERRKERSKIREMRLRLWKEHHSFLLTSLISLIKPKGLDISTCYINLHVKIFSIGLYYFFFNLIQFNE